MRDVTDEPDDSGDSQAPTRVKPKLRGVSHEIAFYAALIGGTLLVVTARTSNERIAAAVYAFSVVNLFGTSALYHRPTWTPERRALMRRLDHAAIFILIAGTYTPIALLALPPEAGARLLWIVWPGAALGVLKSVVWPNAPKPLLAALCVLLGWALVADWSAIVGGVGELGATLILGGGALHTIGAVVYAAKRPDPWPTVFGYHEIFHALVVVAALCHAAFVARLLGWWT